MATVGGTADRIKGLVTIVQKDGKVLQFHRRMRCSVLLAAHPSHKVCLASHGKPQQRARIVSKDSFLETGQIYLLLPDCSHESCSTSSSASGVCCQELVDFSLEQIGRIIGGAGAGSIGRRPSRPARPALEPRSLNCVQSRNPEPVMRVRRHKPAAGNCTWVSSLCSIPEIAPV